MRRKGDVGDMRHWRTLGVAATACAFAFSATPALAHEFTASKTGKTSGTANTEQLFKFGPFHITCEKATAKGAVAAGSTQTFASTIKYNKCSTEGKISSKKIKLPTRFLTPLAIEYHANGFVETGSETEEGIEGEAVLAGGSAELKVNTGLTEEHHASRCNIVWPEQTLPLKAVAKPEGEYSFASFPNMTRPESNVNKFPDGFQHYILVTNALKGIKVEFEGEPCEEWGKEEGAESSGGTYSGSFPAILAGGNFEFS
jgi:hypothetical protein